MSDHKHTQGKWIVREVVDSSWAYATPNYDVLAISDYGSQRVADAYSNQYNARLIAAAPALLEALEAVVNSNKWLANIADLQNIPRPEWYNKAQAALKLVRGT